jgi:molecular chaperone GrpE
MPDEQNDNKPSELEEAQRQRDEYLASWQRTKADFINFKKDEMKRMDEIARYGNESLIKDLIGVMDNFDLGLRSLEKAGHVDKGIYLIRSQIEDILRKRGLEKVDIKVGDAFDPAVAEAMTEIPSDLPHGTIAEEIEPGYRLHDKIIRAARVIVSRGNEGIRNTE